MKDNEYRARFVPLMSLRCVAIFLFVAISAPAQVAAGNSDLRYAHLARGVNLTRWFTYGSPQPIGERERDLLLNAGFTAVRIAVAPQYLLPKWASAEKIASTLTDLDRGIDLFLNSGMAVMLDFQADNDYRDYYLATPEAPGELADLWSRLAARYAGRDPKLLFFEIMNEPDDRFTERDWDREQQRVLAAIRQAAPDHTVLLSSVGWSGLNALISTTPLHDPNVMYVLHYYLPMPFTHQGATWSTPALASLRNVPWPAFLAEPSLADSGSSPLVREYADDGRDAESIDWDMSLAAAWSKKWNVPVVVNEFGAYKPFSPPDSRARWLHDVRAALDHYHLAWSMWDYGAGFDLIDGEGGIDANVSAALGLVKWTGVEPKRKTSAAFSSARPVQMGAAPEALGYAEGILTADINGDGLPDVIVTPVDWPKLEANPVELFVNRGHGLFEPGAFDGPAPTERFVSQIVGGRFDRSGRAGFFFPDRGSDDVIAQSRLAMPPSMPGHMGRLRDASANLPQMAGRVRGAVAADVDGDGVDDLIVFTNGPELWRNDGTGHFSVDAAAFPQDGVHSTCGAFRSGMPGAGTLTVFGAVEGRVYNDDGHGRFTAGPVFPVPPDNGGPAIGGCAVLSGGKVVAVFKNDVIEIVDPRNPAGVQTVKLETSKNGLRRIAVFGSNLLITRPGEAPLILKSGSMEPVVAHLTPGLSVVAGADINHDGKPDLVFGQGPKDPLVARFGQ